MKKLLCGILCATAGAAFSAVTNTVATIDVTEIDSGRSNTVVAVSALDLAGGNLAISNLVKTTDLTVGDSLMAFRDGQYHLWILDSNRVWQPQTRVPIGGNTESAASVQPAANFQMSVGSGIWLSRQTFAKGNPFYIYGAHTDDKTTTVTGNALIGNPTQSDKAPDITGAAEGDVIAVPSDNNRIGIKMYTYKNDGWYSPSGLTEAEGLPTVPAGTGFWYIPTTDTAHTVTVAW